MKTLYLGLVLLALPATAAAQITLTGTSYGQSFDSLGSGLPQGWSLCVSATNSSFGTTADGLFYSAPINANSTTTGSTFRNIASHDLNGRAFGWRPMGTSLTITPYREGALMLSVTNTLGFRDFTLTLDLFTANNVSGDQSYHLEYRVGTVGQFTEIGSFTTGASSSVVTLSAGKSVLTSLSDQSNPVYFRVRGVTTTGTGNLDTLGIDNFELNYAAVPEFASFPTALGVLSFAAVFWTRRRTRAHLSSF